MEQAFACLQYLILQPRGRLSRAEMLYWKAIGRVDVLRESLLTKLPHSDKNNLWKLILKLIFEN